MPRELGSGRRPGLACVALLLCACGTVEDSSSATSAGNSGSPTPPATHASGASSLTPTSAPSTAVLHMNEAQGWSIVAPPGWEVVVQNESGTALTRDDAIAEILVAPSSGFTFEELEAQKVDDLGTWPGVAEIESDLVQLPAGEALRVTVESELATGSQVFYLYVIERGDTQYVLSVRGPQADEDLFADAEAFAESFAIID